MARTRRVAYAASLLVRMGATAVACSRPGVSTLAAAAPVWVAVALGLNCASMLLRSLPWFGALRGALPGDAVPVGGVVRATMIGVIASAVAPGRVCEGVRTRLVSRRLVHGNAVPAVIGTVLSQTVLNVAALLGRGAGRSVRPRAQGDADRHRCPGGARGWALALGTDDPR